MLWSLDASFKTSLVIKSLENIVIKTNLSPGKWKLITTKFYCFVSEVQNKSFICFRELLCNMIKAYSSNAFDDILTKHLF